MMKNDKQFQLLISKLEYLKYSKNTIKVYSYYVDEFINSIGVYPSKLSSKHFQSYLDTYNFTSTSQQNQIISAIKFFYEKVLNKKYNKVFFKRPRKERKLPRVIDKEFLLERISSIKNKKHKAIIGLAYSTGMRVSEVINLKIKDIDSKRMIIHIKNAKGRKDRIVPLTNKILLILRVYFREFNPIEYLFNGQSSLQYSSTSCNKIVKKYLGEEYHFHLLRHSSATSMLESGTSINVIQSILGHSSVKTSMIYTHVSNNLLKLANSPI